MKQWELPWLGHSAAVDVSMVGELMDATGTSSFSDLLWQMLRERLPLTFLTLSTIEPDGNLHGQWLEAGSTEDKDLMLPIFEKWIRDRTYVNDPMWRLMPLLRARSQDAQPLILLHLLNCEDIRDEEWRQTNYERMSIRCRLTLSASHPAVGGLALALFRHASLSEFSEEELNWISGVAPLLMRLALRHQGMHLGKSLQPKLIALEARLGQVRKQLTPREVQVCARILQGSSFEEIGKSIGIKPASVKTYRDRAFEKLAISSRFELFALLLN